MQDQLRHQITRGAVFKWMHEQPITFQPTYKFDKHYSDPLGYDSSEKRRVPAWCDRIFFRGSELTRRSEDLGPSQVRRMRRQPMRAGHSLVSRFDCSS